MAGDATTIARPYAEAVFARAVESNQLESWTDMLAMLAVVARDPAMAGLIASPKLDRQRMTELLLEIGGDRLSDEGRNLVRLLARNRRLSVLPEIARLYEQFRAEHQGSLEVTVTSAFDLEPEQQQRIADVLKTKLGRDIRITSHTEPELIGGFRVRAGDLVIDGSVAGQLGKLAAKMGI
jgi:F-type H+-transporting ATPase subunit delta